MTFLTAGQGRQGNEKAEGRELASGVLLPNSYWRAGSWTAAGNSPTSPLRGDGKNFLQIAANCVLTRWWTRWKAMGSKVGFTFRFYFIFFINLTQRILGTLYLKLYSSTALKPNKKDSLRVWKLGFGKLTLRTRPGAKVVRAFTWLTVLSQFVLDIIFSSTLTNWQKQTIQAKMTDFSFSTNYSCLVFVYSLAGTCIS